MGDRTISRHHSRKDLGYEDSPTSRDLAAIGPAWMEQQAARDDTNWDRRFYPNGVDGVVYAIAVDGPRVYIGGDFRAVGSVAAERIAAWDGTAWHPLSTGMDKRVFALAVIQGILYAGGEFTYAGTCTTTCGRIAAWDGITWTGLSTGIPDTGSFPEVNDLVVSGTLLYAGGRFTAAGTCTVGCSQVAVWDGRTWSPLGNGIETAVAEDYVSALAVSGTTLYAGGYFTQTRLCPTCNNIVKWDGTAWGEVGGGINGAVEALAISGTTLYAGGGFHRAGTCNPCNNIAAWDGTTWSSLGSGMDGPPQALALSGSTLYAAGPGPCRPCANIARWNGTAWEPVGAGADGTVNALIADGGALYAGGQFTRFANCTMGCTRLACGDGSTWSNILPDVQGAGVSDVIATLAVSGTMLYAGGFFTQVGTCTSGCNYSAAWDGTARRCSIWSATMWLAATVRPHRVMRAQPPASNPTV